MLLAALLEDGTADVEVRRRCSGNVGGVSEGGVYETAVHGAGVQYLEKEHAVTLSSDFFPRKANSLPLPPNFILMQRKLGVGVMGIGNSLD